MTYALDELVVKNGFEGIKCDFWSYAFIGCSGLTSVTIPSTVTSIGYREFIGCRGLQEIHFNGTIAQWKKISKDSDWDYEVPSSCKVICTDGETSL